MADRQRLAQLAFIPLVLLLLGLLWTRIQAMRGTPHVVTLPAAGDAARGSPAVGGAGEGAPAATGGGGAAAGPVAAAVSPETPGPILPARDPFVPPAAVQQAVRPPPTPKAEEPAEPVRPMPTLTVQGVFWGITPPRAIVNDQILTPGDTIQGVTILSIDRHGVTVEFQGTRTVLTPAKPGQSSQPGA